MRRKTRGIAALLESARAHLKSGFGEENLTVISGDDGAKPSRWVCTLRA